MEGEPSQPLTATFGVIYYSLMCVPGMDGEPSPPLTATFVVIYYSLMCVPGMDGEPSPPLTARAGPTGAPAPNLNGRTPADGNSVGLGRPSGGG